VIFHDATLREMVEQKPTQAHQLLAIIGIGDSKMQRFGADFLEVIREAEYLGQ
jgi:ATP-dependent DNA helicase RecQ